MYHYEYHLRIKEQGNTFNMFVRSQRYTQSIMEGITEQGDVAVVW